MKTASRTAVCCSRIKAKTKAQKEGILEMAVRMKKRKHKTISRKPRLECILCKKPFKHPDVYGGRCENCFSENCAHIDSVRCKPRKTRTGQDVTFFYNAGSPGSAGRVRSVGRGGVAW